MIQRQAVHCVLGKMAVTSWVCNNVIVYRVPLTKLPNDSNIYRIEKSTWEKLSYIREPLIFLTGCANENTRNVQPTLRCCSGSCLGRVPTLCPLVCDALAIVDHLINMNLLQLLFLFGCAF